MYFLNRSNSLKLPSFIVIEVDLTILSSSINELSSLWPLSGIFCWPQKINVSIIGFNLSLLSLICWTLCE